MDAPPDDRELLRSYLASRDAACPACGYNLRGAVGERCPECARPLTLGIVASGPPAALAWFLLLAFGWVFAAGAMNSTRNIRSAWWYVEGSRQQPVWVQTGTTLIDDGTSAQSLTQYFGALQPGSAAAQPALVPSSAPKRPLFATIWSSVPAYTLASTAWALGLVIASGTGLALLARRRKRPFTPRGDRRLVRLACGVFAVYASWHLAMFIMELA